MTTYLPEMDRATKNKDAYRSKRTLEGPMPKHGSHFGSLGAALEELVSFKTHRGLGNFALDYQIKASDLATLSNDRTRAALIACLEKAVPKRVAFGYDAESPSEEKFMYENLKQLIAKMKHDEENGPFKKHSKEYNEAEKNADLAANILTTLLLRSSPETGIDPMEVESRREFFGTNAITEKKLDGYCQLCWEAIQDFVLIMLIVLGIISIVVEVMTHPGDCTTCWIEGAAILCSVGIVVSVTAGIDYAKQFAFIRLSKTLHETNAKSVIRDGKQVHVVDGDIVVGDILSVNSHNLATIPADCILLGPIAELKMDESTLTGESEGIMKRPGDVILSGTKVIQGSGRMVVIAVGINSVAGKIRARVYDSKDHKDELEGDSEGSPLFVKLDLIAKQIGLAGTAFAAIAFFASCFIGLVIQGDDPKKIVEYFITAITVLAVAVPEGLPLAVTLALAFSSNKMTREQNLVKHLDACETMGCATTICTDKTGTLTANKMAARAVFLAMKNMIVVNPSLKLGSYVNANCSSTSSIDLLARLIAINTMNETILHLNDGKMTVEGASGDPTEVALLTLVHELGMDYEKIRNTTKGRSTVETLAEFLPRGKMFEFSSGRKMMSWAVPNEGGGSRIYCKGAQEVLLARCNRFVNEYGETQEMTATAFETIRKASELYARHGMRCLGLAFADLPKGFDLEKLSDIIMNSDGTPAFEAETNLVALGLVGIEDPLRAEVPAAIDRCYRAGIDVRMVTGDNPNTAVSIAHQAGILRDCHFKEGTTDKVADCLKENVLMTGNEFRATVYRPKDSGEGLEFNQARFDKIWPHLRVLARSSPEDKLALAHGLNQSTLFVDKEACAQLQQEHGITIFPDRQVVAMTGDGTNDAPALKRADIGFAMGVSGTQIAKDAADIILLDDNFASIVTAAKWGRNVYASIQKFLQFQLTVNISAVTIALTGAFAHQKSPLAAIQLLWVNLLMDSLASLALASEPPVDALLEKPPVNRTDNIVTPRMWVNMLGQASYQITVVMTLLFHPNILGVEPGHTVDKAEGEGNSEHYTIIFNAFVWMQLFNEVNCRMLKGELNVFSGVLDNRMFCSVLIMTSILQVLIVEFGSFAFGVSEGGLDAKMWGVCLILGAGSLPVQQFINLVFALFKHWKGRTRKRLKRNRSLATHAYHVHRATLLGHDYEHEQAQPHAELELI